MAAEWGPSSYLDDQWTHFWSGLARLDPEAQRTERDRLRAPTPSTGTAPVVHLPGLDDVVQLGPRAAVSRDDWREFFAAQRAGREPAIDHFVLEEIERRQAMRERIAESPAPAWARDIGEVMTALDNAQDLLSTIAVVGRLIASPVLAAHPAVGIPLMIVAHAAAFLRLATWLGLIASPIYGALCAGPVEGLAAGIPAALFGRNLKGKLSPVIGLNPFSRRARISGGSRLEAFRRQRVSLSNWIEGLQVSRDFFGVGLVFGGLVGAIADSAFGLEQRIRGIPVEWRTPRNPERYHAALSGFVGALPDPALWDYRSAANALIRAPFLVAHDGALEPIERTEVLATTYAALDMLRPVFDRSDLGELIEVAWRDRWTTPAWQAGQTADAWREAGILAPASTSTWLAPGSPRELYGGEYAELGREVAGSALEPITTGRQDDADGLVAAIFTTRLMERLAILMLGEPEAVTYELEPAWALAEACADASLVLHAATPPEAATLLLARYEQLIADRGVRHPSRSQLLELADGTGAQLIPLLPWPDDRPVTGPFTVPAA